MMKSALLIAPCFLLSGCIFISVTKTEPQRPAAAPSEAKSTSSGPSIEPVVVLKPVD